MLHCAEKGRTEFLRTPGTRGATDSVSPSLLRAPLRSFTSTSAWPAASSQKKCIRAPPSAWPFQDKYAPAAPTNGGSISQGTYMITLHGGPSCRSRCSNRLQNFAALGQQFVTAAPFSGVTGFPRHPAGLFSPCIPWTRRSALNPPAGTSSARRFARNRWTKRAGKRRGIFN